MPVGRARTSVLSQLTADANFAMAGYKLTGLGAGSANGNSLRYQQAILQAILTTAGDMLVRGASVAGRLAKGTDGHYLKQGATYPAWAEDLIAALLTTRGDLLYEGASGVARLAKGTAGQALVMGANDPAWAAVPSPLTVAESEAFSGTSPATAAWTDLDLTAIVGSNAALVLVRFHNPNVQISRVAFRTNGDTDEGWDLTYNRGCAQSDVAGSGQAAFVYYMVAADANGIIEWMYERESEGSVTIDVVAYVK